MRRYVFVSHHKLAFGLKDTTDFLTNHHKEIYDINAYLDNEEKSLENQLKDLFISFKQDDEIIVLSDLLGGSVNQKCIPYLCQYPNMHIISGMNLPLAMSLLLYSNDEVMDKEKIEHMVEDSRRQIVYVNHALSLEEEDE